MKYSVYDYTRRAYDYYEGPGPGGTHAGSPSAPTMVKNIGAPPSRASWRLPLGARKVGSGPMPMGRIASLGNEESPVTSPRNLAVVALLGILSWRFLR